VCNGCSIHLSVFSDVFRPIFLHVIHKENTCNDNQINQKLIAIKNHKIVPRILALFNMHLVVQHTIISRSDISNTTTTLLAYNGSKRKGNSVNDPPFRSPNDGCPKEMLYHAKSIIPIPRNVPSLLLTPC
jgi:hypothetical protein